MTRTIETSPFEIQLKSDSGCSQEYFSPGDEIYLSITGGDSPPLEEIHLEIDGRGIERQSQILKAENEEEWKTSLEFSKIPWGRYFLQVKVESKNWSQCESFVFFRGHLEDYTRYFLNEMSHSELDLVENLPSWRKKYLLRRLKSWGVEISPGEDLVAVFRAGQTGEIIFTTHRALTGGKEISYFQLVACWREKGSRLKIELVGEWEDPFRSLRLPNPSRQFLLSYLQKLLELPASIRLREEDRPSLHIPEKKKIQRRLINFSLIFQASALFLLGGWLVTLLFAVGIGFFENHWPPVLLTGAAFFLYPFWKIYRKYPFSYSLFQSPQDWLGDYQIEEIERFLQEVRDKCYLPRQPHLRLYPDLTPMSFSLALPFLNWHHSFRRVYISSHLLSTLNAEEIKALLAIRALKLQNRWQLQGKNLSLLRLGVYLWIMLASLLFAGWGWWLLFASVAFYIWETHQSFWERKIARDCELLLGVEASRAFSAMPLINSWIKMGVRGEIYSRFDLVGRRVLRQLDPTWPGGEARQFTLRCLERLPQGFIHLEKAMDILEEETGSLVSHFQGEKLKVYFQPLQLNWRNFDTHIVDNCLDEVELKPFLENLCSHPVSLFPLLRAREGEPRLEERIIFTAAYSREIPFSVHPPSVSKEEEKK